MKFENSTGIGVATIGEWLVGAVLVGILIWRSTEGDTFEETTTWLLGLGAAATAIFSGLRRSWEGRNNPDA